MEAKLILLGGELARIEIHGLNDAGRVCCLAFRDGIYTGNADAVLADIRAAVKATEWPFSVPGAVNLRRKLARRILGV